MHRAKRIALRGWRRSALNIATWGYYPLVEVATGKVCIGVITMTIPGATVAMTIPTVTIVFEDCE